MYVAKYLTPFQITVVRDQILGENGRAVYRNSKPIFKIEKGVVTEQRIGTKIYATAIDNGNVNFEINQYSDQPFVLPDDSNKNKLKLLYISADMKGKFYEYNGGIRFTSWAKEVKLDDR